jgi:hypothetical protein
MWLDGELSTLTGIVCFARPDLISRNHLPSANTLERVVHTCSVTNPSPFYAYRIFHRGYIHGSSSRSTDCVLRSASLFWTTARHESIKCNKHFPQHEIHAHCACVSGARSGEKQLISYTWVYSKFAYWVRHISLLINSFLSL